MRKPKQKFDLLKECRKLSRINNVIPPNRVEERRYKRNKKIAVRDSQIEY